MSNRTSAPLYGEKTRVAWDNNPHTVVLFYFLNTCLIKTLFLVTLLFELILIIYIILKIYSELNNTRFTLLSNCENKYFMIKTKTTIYNSEI